MHNFIMSYDKLSHRSSVRQDMRRWFFGRQGQALLELSMEKLAATLNNLLGYHILQLGCFQQQHILQGSRIIHKMVAYLPTDETSITDNSFICDAHALPLAADSLDVIVLPYILEFESEPHQILREVERVIIPEGHIVIIGFNPWSLWGLYRLLVLWSKRFPWCGHYFSLTRLKDWLKLVGFEIEVVERFYYSPPLLGRRFPLLEYWGNRYWKWFSGLYMITAKKHVIPLTLVKPNWKHQKEIAVDGIVGSVSSIRPAEE